MDEKSPLLRKVNLEAIGQLSGAEALTAELLEGFEVIEDESIRAWDEDSYDNERIVGSPIFTDPIRIGMPYQNFEKDGITYQSRIVTYTGQHASPTYLIAVTVPHQKRLTEANIVAGAGPIHSESQEFCFYEFEPQRYSSTNQCRRAAIDTKEEAELLSQEFEKAVRHNQNIGETASQASVDYGILVEELNLSARPYNLLKRSGIQTLDDLVSKTRAELEEIPNISKKPIDEIEVALAGIGRTLRKVEGEPDSDQSVSIDELDLNMRAKNILKRAGITTVEQLTSIDELNLNEIPRMGTSTKNIIIDALHAKGLDLVKPEPK